MVWALASAGYTGSQLSSGLVYVRQNLATEKLDAYSLGIIANANPAVARRQACRPSVNPGHQRRPIEVNIGAALSTVGESLN